MTDLTFIHLTDLHLNAPDCKDPTLLQDTETTLRLTFAALSHLETQPAFIAVSGDLTNGGDVPAYQHLADLMSKLVGDVPIVYALGNHDQRQNFAAVFSSLYVDPSKPYDHDRVIKGLHVITLDSTVPGCIGGALTPEQIDWLKARLADHSDTPKLLMLHHGPMLAPGSPAWQSHGGPWDSLEPQSTEALGDAIEDHRVVGMLCGHIHMDRVVHWRGVPVATNVGLHSASDPLAPQDQVRFVAASGFALCSLGAHGLATTFVAHPQDRRLLQRITLPPPPGQDAGANETNP